MNLLRSVQIISLKNNEVILIDAVSIEILRYRRSVAQGTARHADNIHDGEIAECYADRPEWQAGLGGGPTSTDIPPLVAVEPYEHPT